MESFDRLWREGSAPIPFPRELVFMKHTRVVLSSIFNTWGGGGRRKSRRLLTLLFSEESYGAAIVLRVKRKNRPSPLRT